MGVVILPNTVRPDVNIWTHLSTFYFRTKQIKKPNKKKKLLLYSIATNNEMDRCDIVTPSKSQRRNAKKEAKKKVKKGSVAFVPKNSIPFRGWKSKGRHILSFLDDNDFWIHNSQQDNLKRRKKKEKN